MILTKDYLECMKRNLQAVTTPAFDKKLLEEYDSDPDEYHIWTEQDIYEQVRKKLIYFKE